MTVEDVAPQVDPDPLLRGAQFMDAYRLEVNGENLDARKAAERMMAHAPRWVICCWLCATSSSRRSG